MDPLVEKKYLKRQSELRSRINLQNSFQIENLKLVAGVDVAYWSDGDKEFGMCCIVGVDYATREKIDEVEYVGEVSFPYIPGFLAFRELPLILEAVKKLKNFPDLYMFDGNGYLHSRHLGIATHASLELNKPTIGIAKTYLKVEDVDFIMPENKVGSYTDIVVDGEIHGRALRTRKNVKPIFVSCGNWVNLETATQITMHFIEEESRLPIPVRYADMATHIARRKYEK